MLDHDWTPVVDSEPGEELSTYEGHQLTIYWDSQLTDPYSWVFVVDGEGSAKSYAHPEEAKKAAVEVAKKRGSVSE